MIGTLSQLSRTSAPVMQYQHHHCRSDDDVSLSDETDTQAHAQAFSGDGKGDSDDDNNGNLQRFAFVLAYDGAPFHGLAKDPQQPNTIQAHVEYKLAAMLGRPRPGQTNNNNTDRPLNIVLNGRTDAGVHSHGTVFHVDFTRDEVLRFGTMRKHKEQSKKTKDYSNSIGNQQQPDMDPALETARIFCNTLRRGLVGSENPSDQANILQYIQVRAVYPVSKQLFHARKSCVGKQYRYTVHEGHPLPLESRSCWSLHGGRRGRRRRLDVAAMNQVARNCLVGIRDCSLFCRDKNQRRAGRTDYRSPIRHIRCINIRAEPAEELGQVDGPFYNDNGKNDNTHHHDDLPLRRIVITIQADFFLTNMCRRIVGLLVQVGQGKVTPQEIQTHLAPRLECRHSISISSSSSDTASLQSDPINCKNPENGPDLDRFLHTAPAKGLCLDFVLYDSQGNGKDPTLPATAMADEETS